MFVGYQRGISNASEEPRFNLQFRTKDEERARDDRRAGEPDHPGIRPMSSDEKSARNWAADE